MRSFKLLTVTFGIAVFLSGCGGSSDPVVSKPKFTSVKVMGDSLTDSGTYGNLGTGSGFGRIFSVQAPAHRIWTENIAAALGISSLCSFYKFTGTTFTTNPVSGCTSYGIGEARINYTGLGGAASPLSIVKQLQDAALAGPYKSSDLLLIDGGGNDAADLVGAYLAASTDGGVALVTLLQTLGVSIGAGGAPAAGSDYMKALANLLFDSIKSNALDKGATHVAILNLPQIGNTPRLQGTLDLVAAGTALANGGGSAGAAAGANARAQADGLFRIWVNAFNTQLNVRAAGNSSVVVIDFASSLDDQKANPAKYGLTNVTNPACPPVGIGSDGLPTYNFETCTDAALSAQTPPAGATGGANWWKTYAFSDGFHPTPFGYQLISDTATKRLVAANWL